MAQFSQAYIKESSLLPRQVVVQSNPMKSNVDQAKSREGNSENDTGLNTTGIKTMNNMPVELLTSHMLSYSNRVNVIPTLLVVAMSFWMEVVLYQTNLTAQT